MALSVHELRDIAPGHGQPSSRLRLFNLDHLPFFRRYGRAMLRFIFAMIATLSIVLLIWSLAQSARVKRKSGEPGSYGMEMHDPLASTDPTRPIGYADRLHAWIAVATSDFLASFRSAARRDLDIEGRDLSGGIDIFNRKLKSDLPAGPRAEGGFDAAKLFSGKGQLMRAEPGMARSAFTIVPESAPTPGSALREMIPPNRNAAPPLRIPTRPAPVAPPRAETARTESPAPVRFAASTPATPAPAPAAAPSPYPLPAPTPAAPNPATPAVSKEEAAASAALRAGQADLRLFPQAQRAVLELAMRRPNSNARADFEAQLATMTDLRRRAIVQRTTLDAGKDKFEAAGIEDAQAGAIAACLQQLGVLSYLVVARKNVDIQPLIPAFIIVAAAGLPKGKSAALDTLSENIHNCLAPLHRLGTAALFVGAEAAGGQNALDKLSATPGAIVWEP